MATEVEEFNINPQIIIQAFDVEKTLEEFSLSDIGEFYIEHGGVTDPLGQLSSAVMNFIESVVSSAKSAIVGAIHSIESTVKNVVSGIKSAVKSAISSAQSAISSAISGVKSLVQSVYSTVQSIGSSIKSSISDAISTVISRVNSILSSVQSIGQSIIGTIQNTFASIQQAIQSSVSNIISTIQGIISQIQSGFQSVISTIEGVVSSLQQTIQNLASSVISTIQNLASQIQSGFQSVISTIQNLFTNIQQAIQSFATNVVTTLQSIASQIQSGFQSVVTTIQGLVTNIQQAIQSAITNLVSAIQSIVTQIQSGFQTLVGTIQNLITNIQQALQSFASNIVSTIQGIIAQIQSGFQSVITSIQGLYTNIRTFFQNVITQITTSFQGFSQTIQSLFTPVITAIDWIRQQVSKIPQLPSLIWEYIKPFVQPIFDTIKDIPSKMAEISKAFQGFVNPLVGIAQFFDQIRQKFIDFITNIPNYIKSIAEFFGNIAEDPLGWFNDNVVKPLADAFSAIGKWIWEHTPDWLKNAITTAQDWFSNAVDWITKGWQGFVDWVSKIPEHIQNLGNYIYDNAIKPLQDWFNENVVKPLGGAFKPILDFFSGIWENAQNFVKDPIGSISTFLQNVWNTVKGVLSTITESALTFLANLSSAVINATKNVAQTIFNSTTAFLSNVAKGVLSGFWKTISGLINASKNLWGSVGKFLSDIIKSAFETIYKNVAKPIEDAVLSLIKRIITGKSRGEVIETIELLGVSMISFIGSEYMARGMQITLRKLAGILSQYRKTFTIRVRGWGGAKGEPMGVGAEAEAGTGGGFTYTMSFDMGYPLRKIADEMEKYADEFRRGYIYGITIWASQPMMRLASATWRNVIPIELPSLSEMRDITRRHMPIKEKFEQHLETMRRYLALYGYNDEVVAWLTTPVTEEGWFVTIVDRFGNTRLVPISLLYELPTPSDIARMMIHDLFTVPGKPELAFQSFKTLMSMKGYYEDIAKFYYLLHYKYPSMSDLWEFSCRVVAKQTWVNVQPTKEEDLGAENTYSPVQLQSTYGLVKFTSEEVSSKLNTIIQNVLRHYAKWHDYAPFAWLDGWTADNLIYLDLMADIPQRIDARWMYKWQVPIPKEIADLTGSDYFDEKALFLIVTSRGMHPKWLEPITIAECMNALAEERTYARTGVINAFKEGFMSLDGLSKTLSHLTDVKILDKDIPVRFLEGEVKLLALRAKYDRALDILRDYFKDLLRGVTENIIPFDGMTKSLKDEINAVAKSLGLENLALDEDYYKLYQPVADSLRKVRTIERIRYWYRYMLYRILYRFSEGFMSKDEFNKTINDIVNNAKLTDEEKKVFVEIAQLMYDGFYKKTKADGILRKLARGVITHEQAKQELIKLGLTEDLADALIEKHAKTYTLSISTLLSYADEVYIPEELLTKKLEILGVPQDEREIVLQVFKIRPIKDERAKAIRVQIEKFIEGYIDENTLRQELSKLGKFKEEIDLIVQYAKVEKEMEIYKLRIDAILNKIRRGALTIEEARNALSKYITDKDIVEALIEKAVRVYTLSVAQLLSYAEYVDIPEDLLKKKLAILGVPEDEIPIILQVFKVRPLRDEYAKQISEVIKQFIEGMITEEDLRKTLKSLGKSDKEISILVTFAKARKERYKTEYHIDAILNMVKRGAITLDKAKEELSKYIVDKDLIDAIIEKHVKTYTLSIPTLLSYADEVYIPEELLMKKLEILGVPEDERNIILQVFKVRPIKDERAKAIRTQIEKFIVGYIDENTLRQELSKLGKLKEEIDLIVQYAKVEKSMEINKLKIDAILNRLKRGAITIEEATKELSNYIVDKDVVNALIEKYVRVYTLSIATLVSYAEYVDIPEELLKRKLEILGVPKDEIPIILQVFRIRPLRDEYAKQISETLKQFEEGYIDEEKLKSTLKELGKSDKEIQILVTFAKARRWRHKVEYFVDAILNQLRRGAITIDKAKKELSKYIVDESLIDAMIEKTVRVYTLSIPQLLSYAEYVDIPEEFIKKKLEILGVPQDEIPIILQVFRIRPLKDERAKMIRSVIDAYIDGYISKDLLQQNLKNLGKSPREIQILTEFADFEKSQAEAKLAIDAILNRLRRGAITLDEAKKELSKYIVDKALIDAIIEKYVRTSVWTPDKLVSMAEYVPIDIQKLVDKAKMFGYPEEEVKLYPAYLIARNLNEEIGRIITELVYLYVYDIIDEETLRSEIDKVRTLNGEVKKLGVDWIVIDDMEKELIIQRAKLRKMRRQRKST